MRESIIISVAATLVAVSGVVADDQYKVPVPQVDFGNLVDLDSLISGISADSLRAHVETLEGYGVRFTTLTGGMYSRAWIADRFSALGYDSVYVNLSEKQTAPEYYVKFFTYVAVKPGSVYPGQQVIIGAHYDTEWFTYGADDNASGVAGVMEIARALKDVETAVSYLFVLFDGKEFWDELYGSGDYAEEASLRGDSIIYVLNMDMIGYQ
ncbi:MAG: M28 family peptidase, partial [Candidatus Zixiibacteriota bacterium]